ncbi:MAG: adenylate kinase [Actinobacteria bacterium]|nr:adenylate kinase [Actinomycetota bacterium]
MQRILVAGSSGAGKSTLAMELARRCRLPYTELDALYHGPGWVPRAQFLDDVRTLVAGERWVTEWQYAEARPLLLARADTLIWLDLPRRTVMHRVLRRSLLRATGRAPIFNGNTEGFRDWLDPEHPIRWAWTTHSRVAGRVRDAREQRPDLTVVRLRSAAEVQRWLRRLR